MKTFQEILEGKTKLPELPAIKKPSKSKIPTKREEIPDPKKLDCSQVIN